MVSLVITIVVILILSAIVFVTSLDTIDRADFSKYVTNVSDVDAAFYETSTAVNGEQTAVNRPKEMDQVYNYVAKDGYMEVDFLPRSKVPTYTVIKDQGQIGIDLPEMKVESGTGKRVPVKYATTKGGQVFTWPPYDHEGKFYITDTDTVEDKMQTEIIVGGERFEITIDSGDGTLLDMPGLPEEEEPAPEEHSYTAQVQSPEYLLSAADCTSPAIYYYKCTHCNDRGTETYTVGGALGHDFGAFESTRDPNCTETGINTRTCARCGSVETEEIPMDKTKHEESSTPQITNPTCTEAGKEVYNCYRCNVELRVETIPAKGHSFGVWTTEDTPTCAEEGLKVRGCIACTEKETEKIPVDTSKHYGDEYGTQTQKPTCTATGTMTYKCDVCNKVTRTEEISKVPHNYGSFETTKEPTCTTTGTKQKTCSGCNDTITEEIPAKNHDYTSVVTAPTIESEGYTTYTCKDCGDSYVDDRTEKISLEIDFSKLGEFINTNTPKNIVFTTTGATEGTDLSAKQNGYILAWMDGETCYVSVKEAGNKIGLPSDSSEFFSGNANVGYKTVESLDLRGLDVSKVTTMEDMFSGCDKLAEVTLGENFKFAGADGYLPIQSESNVTDADGKWYDVATGEGYVVASIPQNKEATYTAINNKYNIVYNLAGGKFETEAPTTYRKYSLPITLETPVKEGYGFTGWTGANGSNPQTLVTIEKGTTGDKEYTANWSANIVTYNVVYKSTTGIDLGSTTIEKAFGTTNEITAPDITGYNTPASQTIAWDSMTAKTIEFVYEAIEYNVTIDCNGGTGVYSTTYTIESETLELTTPIKLGYEFTGWTGSNGESPEKTITIAKGSTGDKEYKANWKVIDYTITYELNGGTVTNANPSKYNVETETFTLNNPSKEGFAFAGWTGSNNTTPETTVSIEKGTTGNKEYTANWTVNGYEYNVVYKSTSGIELGTTTVLKEYGTTNEITASEITGYETPASQTIAWDSVTPKTIEFIYKPISYSVTIGLNGGTGVSSTSYTIETETFTLGTPEKEGYTFAGWTGDNGSVPQLIVTIEKGSTGARNYAANWTANGVTYNVVYKSTTGVDLGSTTVMYDFGTTNEIVAPEKAGYTTPASQSVTWDTTTQKTIEFKYEAIEYNVTFTLNGGTGVSDRTYTIETETFTLGTPSREGYTFTGWTCENGLAPEKVVSIEKGSTGNKEYTANWSANGYEYNVVYKSTTGVSLGSTTVVKDFGTTNTISAPEKAGYETPESQEIAWDSVTSKTIEFVYEPIEYNVELTLNGGTGVSNRTYTIETEDFTLGTPSRNGYTFAGWTGDNGDTAQTSVSIVKGSTGNKSYTANWNTVSYNITFDLAGGTGVSDRTYTIETEDFTLGTPTRNGYTFTGWTGANGTTAQTSVSIEKGSTGDKEYTANWTANGYTYNVVYESTTGVSLGSTTVAYDFGTTNTISAPEKAGYETPASQEIAWDSVTPKTITFKYEPIKYNVTFTLNGGTGVENRTYTIETETFELGTPTKEGYTFTGWTGANGNTAQTSVNIEKGTIGDKSYTANWSAVSYRITFSLDGGTGVSDRTYTIETETFTLETPSREGYTFIGWTGDNVTTPQTTVTIAKGTTGDKEYTANWSANGYTYNVVYESTTGVDLGSTTVAYDFGTTNEISAPEKEGYETPASQEIAWDSVTPKTITFVYEPIEYNVELTLNGGTLNSIVSKAKVGDLVNYSANGITLWRVFDIVDGEVLITPASGPTSTKLTLSGADNYVNAVNLIEEACDAYTNSSLGITVSNVRSMTVEDINRVTGYTPAASTTKYAYFLSSDSTYDTARVTSGYTKAKASTGSFNPPRFYTWDSAANVTTDENGIQYAYPTEGNPVYVTRTYYNYNTSSYNHVSNSSITVGSLLVNVTGWLASPCVNLDSSGAYFLVGYANSNIGRYQLSWF